MTQLVLDGPFYYRFTADPAPFRSEDHTCIRRTVGRLLSTETTADHPGMLLGKIQSGKTKTFLAAVALAFDNGVDIAVVLTKGTRALSKQTVTRVKKDFASFILQDRLGSSTALANLSTTARTRANVKVSSHARSPPIFRCSCSSAKMAARNKGGVARRSTGRSSGRRPTSRR